MFKIIDSERLSDERFRLVVETDDPSLFTLLSSFDSLVAFAESFRYQSKIALKIKDRELTRDLREIAAQEDRAMILNLYEKTQGENPRVRMNTVLRLLVKAGRDWMCLDGVISILRIAAAERKAAVAKGAETASQKPTPSPSSTPSEAGQVASFPVRGAVPLDLKVGRYTESGVA